VTHGQVDLGIPVVGDAAPSLPRPVRYRLGQDPAFRLSVFDLGLACCAVEFVAATLARPDLLIPEPASVLSDADWTEVLVVSGTVTDMMVPAVRRLYEEMPEPRYVVSFGSCANSGGPYWDSYCVTKGVDQIIPVDVFVPGCPPRPEALVQGIAVLQHKIEAGRQ
jgi:NADH-quinone oxidoreductase subunit B